MKKLFAIILILTSYHSYCQDFDIKEKEELIFRSLKSSAIVNSNDTEWRVMYVMTDTVDEHMQNFIRKKFPKKDWRFFDIKECQVIFKDIAEDSIVPGFHLSTWNYKEAYYFDLAVCLFSRWLGDEVHKIKPVIMCPDPPTGRLYYDTEKEKWVFEDDEQLYNSKRKNTKAPDHSHCPPTDGSVKFF
jgi:hypothetical protein